MKIFFSSDQISKTRNLDANLILRHYKLDLMSRFMEIKFINPKLTQKQPTQQLACSVSIIKR